MVETSPPVTLDSLISPYLHRVTDFVVVGGDGTLNQVVNAIYPTDKSLSLLCAGTGNDFSKSVSIGKTLSAQLQTAVGEKLLRVDLGDCNGRKFVNGVGVGFDGQIVKDMLTRKGLLQGHAAYYYHVLRILASYQARNFSLSIDGDDINSKLILLTIGNGTTFGGGFKLTPHASLTDGYLEACQIKSISPLNRFIHIPKLSQGSHHTLKEVSLQKVREITINENANLEAHIDGEYLGKPPFTIRVLPKALNIRVTD